MNDVTPEMIEMRQRRNRLVEGIACELDRRAADLVPRLDAGQLLELQQRRDAFIRLAKEQPDEFFARCADVNGALRALKSAGIAQPRHDKRRQQSAAYQPAVSEVERSERQGDLLTMFRAEY